jgi:hypothetical protein
MRVSDVQARLRALSRIHGIAELDRLAGELSRRSPVKVAARTSSPMTDSLRNEIRAYARANPDMSQVDIAARFTVNPGRVSEALRGRRS